jgi:superfamily I DNA and RNA helicase
MAGRKNRSSHQARLALRIGSGHQIIKGPPGSGKTLILAHRSLHLCKYQPEGKRILLVCYNIALVGYLKRLLKEKGIGSENKGVQVFHFFELCSSILGETIRYENEDNNYYDFIISEALKRVAAEKSRIEPFDAVLVDEAQDFSNDMLRILLELLKKKGDFVIALDSSQNLYRRKTSWKSIGIQAGGRTHHLNRVYRNTHEIFEFTRKFLGETYRGNKQMALFPDEFALHGDPPDIRSFKSLEEIEAFLPEDISSSIAQEDYKRSEIAVIYDDKVYGPDRFTYDNRALPMRILNRLESFGIPTTWVSRDVRAKEMYDITTDRVSLISIHSSKGLDFDLVYLVGMDQIRPIEITKERLISLVYVAMTRSKYKLVIPYVKETELIKRIKECLQYRS